MGFKRRPYHTRTILQTSLGGRMVDKIKPIEYNREYIKSLLDALQKKGVEPITIAQVLSPPKKIVSLDIIRARFRGG